MHVKYKLKKKNATSSSSSDEDDDDSDKDDGVDPDTDNDSNEDPSELDTDVGSDKPDENPQGGNNNEGDGTVIDVLKILALTVIKSASVAGVKDGYRSVYRTVSTLDFKYTLKRCQRVCKHIKESLPRISKTASKKLINNMRMLKLLTVLYLYAITSWLRRWIYILAQGELVRMRSPRS